MAARKPRTPKTPVAEATEAQIKHETPNEAESKAGFTWTDFINKLNEQFPNEPVSWKRQIAAFVTTLAVNVGLGSVAGYALGCMLVGAAVLGVPLFLQITMYIIGVCITMYFGRLISTPVYDAVANKTIDAYAIKTYHTITGWFKSEPQGVAA